MYTVVNNMLRAGSIGLVGVAGAYISQAVMTDRAGFWDQDGEDDFEENYPFEDDRRDQYDQYDARSDDSRNRRSRRRGNDDDFEVGYDDDDRARW